MSSRWHIGPDHGRSPTIASMCYCVAFERIVTSQLEIDRVPSHVPTIALYPRQLNV